MATITAEERAIMQAHRAYWDSFAARGWAVAYGPVADPAGDYGAGFWSLPDGEDPAKLAAADPAVQAGVGFSCEIAPMPVLVVGKPLV